LSYFVFRLVALGFLANVLRSHRLAPEICRVMTEVTLNLRKDKGIFPIRQIYAVF
jgi:hypothetical protein